MRVCCCCVLMKKKLDWSKRNKSTWKSRRELHLETRRDPSHETTNKTKVDEKSDENAADPTIQKRKKSSSCVGEEVISFSFAHKSFFQKARARQKWWKCVFGRWKVSSLGSHSYSHSRGRKRERDRAGGARAFFARGKAGALFSSGFFFPAKHRIKLVESLLLRFGFGRR